MVGRRRKQLLREPVSATISAMSHEGRGIAKIDGKTTFISGALLNEDVLFTYTRRRSSFDEGQVSDIISASKDRVVPDCQHFGVCGGCSLQHMHHDAQIDLKYRSFSELLRKEVGGGPSEWADPITASRWGYRRKARLSVKYVIKKQKVLVGFRERNGRFVADVLSCPILHASVGNEIEALSDLIYSLSIRESIPQIEVSIGDDATAIIVRHLVDMPMDDKEAFIHFARARQWLLFLQPEGLDSIVLIEPQDRLPYLHYQLSQYDLSMQFKPEQFIQVNAEMNQLMLSQALEWLALEAADRVLDLFCGIGNITLPVARQGVAQVVGVEGVLSAVDQATRNAERNHVNNATFFCADLFQIDYNEQWAHAQYDKVILDPPRAGAKEIISLISRWQPTRCVYISCNPSTLARDTKMMIEQGYRLEKAGIMDMFAHTQHVEVMALFVKE